MSLAAGTRLGPYEILAPLGAGGMGEVYRARDSKLKREVALKVLPDVFAGDPERMARFQREAEVLAALNHPNIAQIYGVEAGALVMELVEGESPKGPLPLETALHYARQIADALEAAHEKGIVHRDLKPANIKVRPDGTVKVLDFGLAQVAPGSGSATENSPTLTLGPTQAGVILGTAAYMSPEQARGKVVDKRADIWAFGVVLYEMLTGKRLFEGEDLTETIASVVKDAPRLDRAPAQVRRLLRKCLEKDPKKRLRDIGDVWGFLEDGPESGPTWSRLGLMAWAVSGVLAVALAVALWAPWRHPQPAALTVTRFTTALPEGIGPIGAIAVSPDGSRVAFVGGPRQEIYVRMMDQIETRLIPGTDGTVFLSFSPDGQWIGYADGVQLRKVPVAGGPSRVLAEAASGVGPPVPNWGDDGNILFSSKGVLLRAPSGGGQPQILAAPDAKSGERWYAAPQLLPGGSKVLVTIWKVSGLAGAVVTAVLNLQTGEKKIVIERPEMAHFANTDPTSAMGHLVFYDQTTGSVNAVPFDLHRLLVKGSPVPVLEGVPSFAGPFASFDFSDSGTLAYVTGGLAAGTGGAPIDVNRTLVWRDRKGAEQPLPAPPRYYTSPAISPDGERVAVQIDEASLPGDSGDIWLYSLARSTLTRLTSEGRDFTPVWTPDAKLIYSSYSGTPTQGYELRSIPADGSGTGTAISAQRLYRLYATSVSPDGKMATGFDVFRPGRRSRRYGMWLLSLGGASADAKPQPFLDSQFSKLLPQFSPDGRWVAYESDETGRFEIYAVPYPGPGGKVLLSNDGGREPRWARNGRELFYRNGDKMMAVDIRTAPAFRAGVPQLLFEGRNYFAESDYPHWGWSYDVAPDGKRFLMIKAAAAQTAGPAQLHVVVNWFEELRRRVPVGKQK